MFKVTKSYRDLPASHRQPNHEGHCRLIHGHNWGFDIIFAADKLDDNQFVVDLGELDELKKWFADTFDHTLLLNEDDPCLSFLQEKLGTKVSPSLGKLASIIVVPNCGMEGLAKWTYHMVNAFLCKHLSDPVRDRNLHCIEVTVYEDSKNSATYNDLIMSNL